MPNSCRRFLVQYCLFQVLVFFFVSITSPALASDPLPSWNEGQTKQSIPDFVATVTNQTSKKFVPAAERIAVFDNDGTLWAEQPAYFQLLFAIDRIHALAPQHPEWKERQPFKAVLDHDMAALAQSGKKGITGIAHSFP